MASVRERILDTIVSTLDAAGKPAGLAVERGRLRDVEKDEMPRILVSWLGDARVNVHGGAVPVEERQLRVRLTVYAQGDDQHMDPYLVWAEKALKADTSLGGIVRDIQYRDATPDLRLSGVQLVAGGVEFEVTYRQDLHDPETQSNP